MLVDETALKQHIKEGPRGLYLLYGAEGYLVEQYARLLARHAVEEDFDAFNLQRFDGQEVSMEALEEAVEALPLMAEQKCVLVRDLDAGGSQADRILELVQALPDTCVLVLWQMTVQPDGKKGWKTFLQYAEQHGTVAKFDRKSTEDAARMLVSGAKRRGCTLQPADARYMVEQAGNDLILLLGELDKLSALAEDGPITRELIDRAGTKNLEARIYDLTKAIFARRAEEAFRLLHQLFVLREEPLVMLGTLSNAFADVYRVKIAVAGGIRPADLAADFKSYKGREWKLRNAARDAAAVSVETLRDALEILAKTDAALKSGRTDHRTLLEETVARLIGRIREG